MNTNSNTYTVIYSIILVVVVAAVLAFAAMFLKPMQYDNVKKDTIGLILTAATIEGEDILATYQQEIESAILVDINGEVVGTLNVEEPRHRAPPPRGGRRRRLAPSQHRTRTL